MYNRLQNTFLKKSSKSILLLGPRQVGKSTLIRNLRTDLEINLANEQEYFLFQSEKGELERRLAAKAAKTIFIDEIQRIPSLTNTIQYLIDKNPRLKFYLSGSSARKLRRGQANLMPGRVFISYLAPLCVSEIGSDWNEKKALAYGTLPGVYSLKSDEERKHLLRSYSSIYVKEEIQAEALVRQIDGFVRFLQSASLHAGSYLDYSKLAKQAKIPRQSVVRHYEVLEDTLITYRVGNDPLIDTEEVDLVRHPRFYFFDLGVLNALRRSFSYNEERVGFLFEHLVCNQLHNSATAKNKEFDIFNFRTRGGLEVDFIVKIEDARFAVECKAATSVHSNELRPLKLINQHYKKINRIVIYRGNRELKEDGIWILPLQKALSVMGL